jgi:hypothetical protein
MNSFFLPSCGGVGGGWFFSGEVGRGLDSFWLIKYRYLQKSNQTKRALTRHICIELNFEK